MCSAIISIDMDRYERYVKNGDDGFYYFSVFHWLDVADCAVAVLSEPVDKHDRNVYELGTEALSNEQRAAIFTKVLGKPITYEQQSYEDFYKSTISMGLPHSLVYNFAMATSKDICDSTTPEIALITGRPLRTLEEWIKDNIKVFQ